ncbi:hypothetical protein BJV78DRAFT_888730 [Lactifluus subvellereus]|nr:hypothetical protein BJV78DRAFT_888730 [Lactifluus subvellereus]
MIPLDTGRDYHTRRTYSLVLPLLSTPSSVNDSPVILPDAPGLRMWNPAPTASLMARPLCVTSQRPGLVIMDQVQVLDFHSVSGFLNWLNPTAHSIRTISRFWLPRRVVISMVLPPEYQPSSLGFASGGAHCRVCLPAHPLHGQWTSARQLVCVFPEPPGSGSTMCIRMVKLDNTIM